MRLHVAQATAKALHEGVLGRLAGCDIVPLDLPLLRPAQDGDRGEFGAVAHREALEREPLWP